MTHVASQPVAAAAPEQPTTSVLEKHATDVAREIMGGDTQAVGEGERGFDITMIITLIITIIQTLVQKCPAPTPQVRGFFKRPGLRQRAALLKTTKESCECCGANAYVGRIYQSLLTRGTGLADPDVGAIIKEASDDRNLLI